MGIDDIPFVDTPLCTAASAGHTHFAFEMMNLKPSFTKKLNPEGLTPLDLALRNGYLITVRLLVNFVKELIHGKGREMLTPLHYVAEKGHIDLLAKFLSSILVNWYVITYPGMEQQLISNSSHIFQGPAEQDNH
ncbi:hypothetical protein ACSBR1_034357 [Camellia fascicularis]